MKNKFKSFSEINNSEFTIVQPAFFKRGYELRSGEDLIASIQQKGIFGSNFEVEIFDQKWEVYKPSVWKRNIAVRKAGYDLPIANYNEKLFSKTGYAELPKGERVLISKPFFKRDIEANTEKGEFLFSITLKFSIKDNALIKLNTKSGLLEKYPWLIILGWFILLERQRAAAAAA